MFKEQGRKGESERGREGERAGECVIETVPTKVINKLMFDKQVHERFQLTVKVPRIVTISVCL